MKKEILILVIILLVIKFDSLSAQTETKKAGVYLSCNDFIRNAPYAEGSFKIKHKIEIRRYKLFKIRSVDKRIKRRFIKKNAWCIVDGNNLYLNCYRISFRSGYTKVEESGRYLFFRSPPVLSIREETSIQKAGMYGGAIGGAVATGVILQKYKRTFYILDLKSGVPHNLNANYLLWILEEEPDLLAQYSQEKEQEELETQLKYVRLLNERNSDAYLY